MPKTLITRRRFLHSSAVTTAALFAAPAFLRANSLNEKLNLGLIGVGNKGAENLKNLADQNVVALCDVDENFLNAASQTHPGAKQYRDFRKMLEQRDIDAVVVTIPDHNHAVAAMAAIQLGKHVYCEKPLTHDLHEARQLARAAREHKVATQMGNGGHASDSLRSAVEWIQADVIGPVGEVHAWTDRPIWPQGIKRPADTPPIPKNIDWDLWIGSAPMRPYHPAYHPFKWRGWWDFGTGALGDMGCHIIDAAFWSLQLGYPETVEAESSPVNNETAPNWSIVRYQFPARGELPPVKLTWYDGGKLPAGELLDLAADEKFPKNGSLFVGRKGRLLLMQGKSELLPEHQWRDFQPPPKTIPRSAGHYAEWIAACKGGPAAFSNFNYAGPLTELVLLGNLALRVGGKIQWDGRDLKARNAPEADRYIRREYRRGWNL